MKKRVKAHCIASVTTICISLAIGSLLPTTPGWATFVPSPNPNLWFMPPSGTKACGYQQIGYVVCGSDYDTHQESGSQVLDKPGDEVATMKYREMNINDNWFVTKGDKIQCGYYEGAISYAWLEYRTPIEQGSSTVTAVVPDWAHLADDNPFSCAVASSVNTYIIGSVVHSNWENISAWCGGPGVWWRITWVVKDAHGNPFPSEISGCLRATEGFSTWTPPPPCMQGFADLSSWYPNPYFTDNYMWCHACVPGTPCAQGNPDPMLTFYQVMAAWIVSPYQPYNVNVKTKNVTVKYWCDHINWYY